MKDGKISPKLKCNEKERERERERKRERERERLSKGCRRKII